MVQFIKPGKPQGGEPPKPVKTQGSLFGNGQEGRYGNDDPMEDSRNPLKRLPVYERNLKAEEARAREKFAGTKAGKAAGRKAVQETEAHVKGQPKSEAKISVGFSCHLSHPPYPVAPGYVIYGGSGINPHLKDCDVYVSLDKARYPGERSRPWTDGEDFIFDIPNFGVPADPAEFRKLVEWLAEQVKAGRKVHVGCMAGHGRTGMVLAALHILMTGDKDAIQHVRANYCTQVVENEKQTRFLLEHWGVSHAPPRPGRAHPKGEKATTRAAPLRYGFQDDTWKDSALDSANAHRFDVEPLGEFTADDLDDLTGLEPREERHNSWQANNPFEAPAPVARVPSPSGAWYDEDDDPAERVAERG